MSDKLDSSKLLGILNEKWQNTGCPMCGTRQWQVDTKIYELREYNQGTLVIGGQSSIFPVVPIVCTNCGNTIFVNPMITKVIKEEK